MAIGPGTPHTVYNCGFNYAEAINHWDPAWVSYGHEYDEVSNESLYLSIALSMFIQL